MKRIIYFFLLVCIIPLSKVKAQSCNCEARLVQVGDCCYSLQMRFPVSRTCEEADFRVVYFNTDVLSGFTSQISGKVTTPFGIGVNVNADRTFATFSSVNDLVDLAGLNNWFEIGQLCLENASPGASVFSVAASPSENSRPTCTVEFELNVSCKKPTVPVDTTKFYGDTLANKPTKIKAFEDAYYVTGTVEKYGNEYGTVTKFDLITGDLLWQIELDTPSIITDFEFEPIKKDLILVGRTPIQQNPNGADNESLIVNIRGTDGTHIGSQLLQYDGPEGLHRIVRQANPANPAYPYYITGYKTSAPTVSIPDQTLLYNVNFLGQVNWIKTYERPGTSTRFEAWRGLFARANGHVVMTGNDFNQTGIIFDVDGATGSAAAYELGSGYRLNDGVELPGSFMAIAGEDLSFNEGIFLVLNPLFGYDDVARYPNLSGFYDMGLDNLDRVYTTTEVKNTSDPTWAILRANYGGPGAGLTNSFLKSIKNSFTDADIANGRIWVRDDQDAVFYTDGRINSGGFGNYDLVIGIYDLDVSDACAVDLSLIRDTNQYPDGQIPVAEIDVNRPRFVKLGIRKIFYDCRQFCNFNGGNCSADFSWTSNCLEATFTDLSTGTAPLTYAWDINCDGSIESTAQHPTLTFPAPGEYKVCLTITDADGCTDTFSDKVVIEDTAPPVLTCMDVSFPTDPEQCEATITIPHMVTDDCDPSPTVICEIDGVPVGPTVSLPKGVHQVICIAEDNAGNKDTCSFEITIEDLENPVVECPSDITVSVPACEGGAEVFFIDPIYGDNCPMVQFASTHQSGDFFPCGTTSVTYTATDMSGNVSSCSFNVTVNCICGAIDTAFISCTPGKYEYDYTVVVNNLTGAADPSSDCTVEVLSNQLNTNVTVNSVNWAGSQATVTGTVSNGVAPIPLNLDLFVRLTCDCGGGSVGCDLPFSLETPCCDTLMIEDQMVCRTDSEYFVSIIGCDDLEFVDQVNWYVAPAPCPPDSFGLPFKSIPGNECVDLCLNPSFFSGDLCIYAEVILNDSAGPCRRLLTNVAQILLCDPIQCSISGQEFCYSGSPITPAPLTIELVPATPDCDYTIQWYDANGPLAGETGLTYQPPALDFLGDVTDCYYDHVFKAVITDSCGVRECSAIIRLYNDDAPTGSLYMDPLEPLPFCPGEDATLRYEPECAGEPPMWNWLISTDGVSYSPIPESGNFNPVYNTNRLFADTWFAVDIQNGVCPVDRVAYKIDVKDPLKITSFTAEYDDPCDPTMVDMFLAVDPCFSIKGAACDCDYTVEWYKNGNLIATSDHTSSPVSLSYADPDGIFEGNYYVVVKDNCCEGRVEKSTVVVLEPVCEALVAGPCFICMSDPAPEAEIVGIIKNLPLGVSCTYQWTASGGGNILSGSNTETIVVNTPGIYTFTASCAGCVKEVVFELTECFTVGVDELESEGVSVHVFPNPASGLLQLKVEETTDTGPYFLQVLDVNNKEMSSRALGRGILQTSLEISDYPAGVYFLKIFNKEGKVTQRMFVKQ